MFDTFFSDFLKQFPDQELKPKAHFLHHYPLMIKKFGSLIKTLRFEAKHCYFKTMSQGSKSRKNICLTLAKRHQMSMYLNYIEQDLLKHKNPQGIMIKEMVVEALDQPVYNVLTERLDITSSDIFSQSKAVLFEGQRYNKDEVVVLDFVNDEPLFGLIKLVCYFKKEVYVLCDLLIILQFDTHLNSYEVTPSGVLDLVDLNDLHDYHPLGIYEISGKKFVPLAHRIDCVI